LRFFSKLWVAEDDTAGFGAIMRGILKEIPHNSLAALLMLLCGIV